MAGHLTEAARAELDSHLADCPSCRQEAANLQAVWAKLALLPEKEPSPALDARFHAMLDAYRQGLKQGSGDVSPRATLADWLARLWPRQPALQFAIAVLLFALGLLLGQSRTRLQRKETVAGTTNEQVLAQLRQEVSNMKQMVMLSLLQQQSASERLRGVECSYQFKDPDEQVLSALLRALDSDPNVNVRLAAVDALQQFARNAHVRKGLLDSLSRQPSPLVQIELINTMVTLKDKESVPVFKALLQDKETNKTVRERAAWGLEQLG
ncbi:MAG: HEAT repeat domain-containing protein [Verrucomicrobia bacterium]|nr:HEAT repeat domain-containing protein [Verrucomicrobiota bacterium]